MTAPSQRVTSPLVERWDRAQNDTPSQLEAEQQVAIAEIETTIGGDS